MNLNGAWRDAREADFMPQPAMTDMKAQSRWTAEFGSAPQAQMPIAPNQVSAMQQPTYMQGNMYGMGRPRGMFSNMSMMTPPVQVSDKGKGKSREIDFEAAFAQLDMSLGPQHQESARIEELDDTADLGAALSEAATKDEEKDGVLGSDFETFVYIVFLVSGQMLILLNQRVESSTRLRTPSTDRGHGEMGSRIQSADEWSERRVGV